MRRVRVVLEVQMGMGGACGLHNPYLLGIKRLVTSIHDHGLLKNSKLPPVL